MDDRQLRTFLKVAEMGSFARAGETLYISKVAVMKQIEALEKEIGVELFKRTNRGSLLTDAGKAFYQDSTAIISSMQKAVARAQTFSKKQAHVIRIGTSILRPCQELLTKWSQITEKRTDIPKFQFQIIPLADDAVGKNDILHLLGREVDCFMSPCDSRKWQREANILVLREISCCMAVATGNVLSSKQCLNWDDLEGQRLMLRVDDDSPVLSAMRQEIVSQHPGITLIDAGPKYDMYTFNQCEAQGCLMESLEIWNNVHPGILNKSMAWDYKMPYGIVYSKNPSSDLRKFIEYLGSKA